MLQRFKAKLKGNYGEWLIAKKLNQLDRKKYTVLHDVKFKIHGKISQIDHVVVSDYGLFVIETKNYKGIIRGFEGSERWTQKIHQHQYEFYNPIRQNKGHIYALNHVLKKTTADDYVSIIAFTNKSQLKIKSSTPVVHAQELLKTVRRYQSKKFDKNSKSAIIHMIKKANLNG